MKRTLSAKTALVLALFMAGCTVGPDYRRPAMNTPSEFRAPQGATSQLPVDVSLGDVGWWTTFQDPQLQSFIREALTNSYDIQIAATRVLQAEAALRITRSQFFTSINAFSVSSS